MNTLETGGSAEAELLARAWAVARHAYAPHSGCRVGAAVLTRDGGIFAGCNVENDSFGLTICAERGAIAAAVAAEGAGLRVAAVAVVVERRRAFSPCGACRQVIAQFADADAPVLYQGRSARITRTTIGALLPAGFAL